MKMRYSYAGGLFIALIFCALLAPASAQAQSQATCRWAEAGKPGAAGNVIVSPSEVSGIAIGKGSVFYAIDSANKKVYRSQNAGIGWEDITSYLNAAAAVLPVTRIAVAPDNAAIVAVVTNAGTKVCLSTNGGFSWIDTSVPSLTGTIQTITISKQYTEAGNTLREIAIGTADWGDAAATTTGQVWVFQFGELFSSWRNQNITVDPSHVGGEISAIAYSPSYQVDRTILVIASTSSSDVAPAYQNKTWLCTGERNTSAGTTSWNSPTYPGYPVEIGTLASPSAGDAPGVSQIISSLALPSDYDGSQSSSRKVFSSYDRQPDAMNANDDVYRLDDTIASRLNANGGAVINIASLAYYGTLTSGELLAGDVSPVDSLHAGVQWTVNPFDPSPTWQTATQPPSGPGNAQMGWSSDGTVAYCGTGQNPSVPLDESAFSRSLDGGDTWEQISLIDTSLTLLDVAVAPSPQSLFLATTSAAGIESVWRSAGEPLSRYWGRVLTINTTSNKVILRLSPNYGTDYTLYAAEVGGDLIMMSHNRGNSWHQRLAPGAVIDMAVADRDTVYVALSGGLISKSINGAWFWQNLVSTSLPNINMLSIASKDTILVGGKNGEVAYSTDGGASFTQTTNLGAGNVWVVADTNYGENGIIYVGNGNKIYQQTIGSNGWECIRTLGASQQTTGLAVTNGILYGAWYDSAAHSSGVERCLEPITLIPEWDTMDIGAEAVKFDITPDSFQVLSTDTEVWLWAIDTSSQGLMAYDDTMAKAVVTVNVPADVPNDPSSGRNIDFNITWSKPSNATYYNLGIYCDANCTQLAWGPGSLGYPATVTVGGPPVNLPVFMPAQPLSPALVVPNGVLAGGVKYYVRVFVGDESPGDQIRSPFDPAAIKVGSFMVAAGAPITMPAAGPTLLSPTPGDITVPLRPGFSWSTMPGATGATGATSYEFILATNAALTQTLAGTPTTVNAPSFSLSADLNYDTTYYYAVKVTAPTTSAQSIASFHTMAKPTAPVTVSPPVTVTQEVTSPSWIWAIVIIGAILVIAVVVLLIFIVRTGR